MWEDIGNQNNFLPISNGWDFIFGNEAYFSMHFYSIAISLILLMNSKGFGWKALIGSVAFPLGYFSYILIFTTQFGVTKNATGLVVGDWEYGQYHAVWEIFGKLPFPYVTVVCYSLVAVYIFTTIFLRNVLIFDNKWKHSEMVVFPRISILIRRQFNRLKLFLKKNISIPISKLL
jgi:hypothetical protein